MWSSAHTWHYLVILLAQCVNLIEQIPVLLFHFSQSLLSLFQPLVGLLQACCRILIDSFQSLQFICLHSVLRNARRNAVTDSVIFNSMEHAKLTHSVSRFFIFSSRSARFTFNREILFSCSVMRLLVVSSSFRSASCNQRHDKLMNV